MKRSVVALLGSIIFGLAAPVSHAGFTFGPVVIELAPAGPKSSAAITVRNPSDEKIPVMIYIVKREPQPDGKEEFKESPEIDDLFQIYPSQLVLNANELRTVRISWIGEPQIKTEQAFRLIAEELPFSMDLGTPTDNKVRAKIKIATKYVGSIYIAPPDAKPDLQMIAKAADPEFKDQQGKIQVEVTNIGTKHVAPKGIPIKIKTATDATLDIPVDELRKVTNENFLVGKMRRFFLPAPAQLPPGPYKVSFELPQSQ